MSRYKWPLVGQHMGVALCHSKLPFKVTNDAATSKQPQTSASPFTWFKASEEATRKALVSFSSYPAPLHSCGEKNGFELELIRLVERICHA